jgi:hypothetical protein
MPKYDKDKIEEYLGRTLRATDPIVNRVKESIEEYRSLLKEDPIFLFLEDAINNEGIRNFVNVILLGNQLYSEFTIDRAQNGFLCLRLKNNVVSIQMPQRAHLSFDKVTDQSRLHLVFNLLGLDSPVRLTATGENCAHLLDLMKNHILPQMRL